MKLSKTAACIVAASLASSLSAVEINQVLDFQGALGYSSRVVHGSTFDDIGTPGHLLYLPVITLRKNEYFAPVLMIEIQQDNRPIAEDAFLKESADFIAKPAWKYLDDNGNEATVYGSAKRRVTKAVDTDEWSKGLYDYEEFGGGLGLSRAHVFGLESLGWDLSLMHRSYANWHNRSAQFAGLNYNYYEKDTLIPALGLNLALPPSEHGTMTLNYVLQARDYIDSYVILPDSASAVNPSLRRVDTFHSLKVASYKEEATWTRGLSLDAGYYLSNQNYWDIFNAQYFEDYYSFYSIGINPEISWLLQGKPNGHKVTFGYKLAFTNYIHRNIRNENASVISRGAQADVENQFTLRGNFVLTRWCDLYLVGMHDMLRSNQEYEPAVKYSYDLYHVELGLGLHY